MRLARGLSAAVLLAPLSFSAGAVSRTGPVHELMVTPQKLEYITSVDANASGTRAICWTSTDLISELRAQVQLISPDGTSPLGLMSMPGDGTAFAQCSIDGSGNTYISYVDLDRTDPAYSVNTWKLAKLPAGSSTPVELDSQPLTELALPLPRPVLVGNEIWWVLPRGLNPDVSFELRRYDLAGTLLGASTLVEYFGANDPELAIGRPVGGTVVAGPGGRIFSFTRLGAAYHAQTVAYMRLDENGTPGPEIHVPLHGAQAYTMLTAPLTVSADGSITVAWSDRNDYCLEEECLRPTSVFVSRFDAEDQLIVDAVEHVAESFEHNIFPSLATLADGTVLMTFTALSGFTFTTDAAVVTRALDSTGRRKGQNHFAAGNAPAAFSAIAAIPGSDAAVLGWGPAHDLQGATTLDVSVNNVVAYDTLASTVQNVSRRARGVLSGVRLRLIGPDGLVQRIRDRFFGDGEDPQPE